MTRILSIFSASIFAVAISAFALNPSSAAQAFDLTQQFRSAAPGFANLQVYEIGGIVLIRGRVADRATAEQAGAIAQSLGYTRVANLVEVVTPPDDVKIRLAAERALGMRRSLDGCKFRIDSRDGIVHVAGTVAEDIQKDEIISVLRSVDGVRDVRADLTR